MKLTTFSCMACDKDNLYHERFGCAAKAQPFLDEMRLEIETEILENLTSYVRRRRKEIREKQSDSRDLAIRESYKETKSLRQTAKEFGISHEQVRTIVTQETVTRTVAPSHSGR